jgi:hypothetical protein
MRTGKHEEVARLASGSRAAVEVGFGAIDDTAGEADPEVAVSADGLRRSRTYPPNTE